LVSVAFHNHHSRLLAAAEKAERQKERVLVLPLDKSRSL
jgi:hypothetical protein